jgi:hypothetical protein
MDPQGGRCRWIFPVRVLPLPLWVLSLLLLLAPSTYGQVLTLTPSLSLSERYDDNIFQTSSNKESDFVTVVTPAIRVQYTPAPETTLDIDYRAAIEFFAENSGQNQVSQHGFLRLTFPLARVLSLDVRDTLVITEEPGERVLGIDEVTGLRPVSEQSRRRTLQNRAHGSLELRLAPRTTLGLLFESFLDDVDVPSEVDEFRYTVGAELDYLAHVARGSRVSVAYTVTLHTFDENRPVRPGTEQADFQVHAVNAGVHHNFSPTLSGSATVGYAITTSDDPAEDENSTIIASVSINKTLRTGQASFGYRRRFTSGGGEGGSVIAATVVASFSARITPKVTASLGGNLSFFDFQRATGDDRMFWTVRPALAYQLLRVWRLAVAYDYAVTDFDDAEAADRVDQRLTFSSRFTLRESLFLDLTYRHALRRFDDGGEVEEFDRNEVMLAFTYAPPLRF